MEHSKILGTEGQVSDMGSGQEDSGSWGPKCMAGSQRNLRATPAYELAGFFPLSGFCVAVLNLAAH